MIQNIQQPFSLSVLVNYNYTPVGIVLKLINSINQVDSYSTIVTVADWLQRTYTTNISGARAEICIYGTWAYQATLEISGVTFPVGLRVSDNYTVIVK